MRSRIEVIVDEKLPLTERLAKLRKRQEDIRSRLFLLSSAKFAAQSSANSALRSQSRLDRAFNSALRTRGFVPSAPRVSFYDSHKQAVDRLESIAKDTREAEKELKDVEQEIATLEKQLEERKELPESLVQAVRQLATDGPARAREPAKKLLGVYDKALVGDAQAQYEMGQILSVGQLGLPKDPKRATKWYAAAAAQGHKAACDALNR